MKRERWVAILIAEAVVAAGAGVALGARPVEAVRHFFADPSTQAGRAGDANKGTKVAGHGMKPPAKLPKINDRLPNLEPAGRAPMRDVLAMTKGRNVKAVTQVVVATRDVTVEGIGGDGKRVIITADAEGRISSHYLEDSPYHRLRHPDAVARMDAKQVMDKAEKQLQTTQRFNRLIVQNRGGEPDTVEVQFGLGTGSGTIEYRVKDMKVIARS